MQTDGGFPSPLIAKTLCKSNTESQMPINIAEYRCLLISPSDVEEERQALSELVGNWNASVGRGLDARIDLVRWETHAVPDASTAPQAAINEQLLADCDLAVAVFWSRLGTPTAEFESGSVEEIEQLRRRGVRVLVYFSEQPIPQDALTSDQFARLQREHDRLRREGLVSTYRDISHLREQVTLHLTTLVTQMLVREKETISDVSDSPASTAPKPDVRIRISYMYTLGGVGPSREIISVKVENHSTQPVFTGNIGFRLRDTNAGLLPVSDAITGQPQYRRKLIPGESYTFYVADY